MSQASFTRVAGLRDPGLEALLHALSAALDPRSVDAGRDWVAPLATRLRTVRAADPALQLDALGERVVASFAVLRPAAVPAGITDLVPDRVLARGAGQELAVALVASAVAHRVGWDIDVVHGAGVVALAHRDIAEPLVSVPRYDGRLMDGRDLEPDGDVRWLCPHEGAAALLDAVAVRAHDIGRWDLRARARELLLALPLAPQEHLRRRVDAARAASSWN